MKKQLYSFRNRDYSYKKREVPGLIVETESEKAEWIGAQKRNALRKERRIEGY